MGMKLARSLALAPIALSIFAAPTPAHAAFGCATANSSCSYLAGGGTATYVCAGTGSCTVRVNGNVVSSCTSTGGCTGRFPVSRCAFVTLTHIGTGGGFISDTGTPCIGL